MNDKILCKPWLLDCRPASARSKLTQLAPYCTAPGVSPNSIGDDHMRGMLEAFLAESDQNKPEHKVAEAIKIWNRLRGEVYG